MTVHSLQHQLQRGLSWRTTVLMLLVWGLGIVGVHIWAQQWMADELAQDSQQLATMIELHNDALQVDSRAHRVNFSQALSGHYFVIHGQQIKRVLSPSLDGFVIQLPERVGRQPMVFTAEGPAQSRLLVHFAEYDLGGRWFDVAVARDNRLMQQALNRFNWLFSLLMGLVWLALLLWQRRSVSKGFKPVNKMTHNLALDGLQENLFAKNWPAEWMALADRLHQALIQLRAKMLRDEQSADSYQVVWPHDLQRVIEPYHVAHPEIEIRLSFKPASFHLLVAQQDMTALVKNLLDNATQWGRSQIWLTVTHQEDQLCFTVEDDGEGMAPERVAQIQQRNANKVAGESPSGLMVVEDIVRAYQGKLEFGHSETLGGLRVKLCLNRPNL